MLCFLLCERQVFSPKFEWTVLIAILLNVGIMSLEYETDGGRNEQLISIATACNEAFAYIFLLEMALKHLALGLRKYWADNWNRFDGAIVSISMAELWPWAAALDAQRPACSMSRATPSPLR